MSKVSNIKIPKKNAISILMTSMFLLSGCEDSQPEVRVIYKDPTPEQVQKAVDEALAKLNKEDAELKAFLEEIKKTNPEVVGARYAYENGEKVLKVAMNNSADSGLSEYVVPVATGALAGYVGASLAQKLVSNTRPSVGGLPDCDLDDLLEGDPDCQSGARTGWHYRGYPTYHYDDLGYYSSTVKKERKVYSQQTSKKSAAETAKAIKAKAISNHIKEAEKRASATKQQQGGYDANGYNSLGFNSKGFDRHGKQLSTDGSPRVSSSQPYKRSVEISKSQPEKKATKAVLTEKRQAFSTKRSTSRSSNMSFGSSSRWGG